jgi:hypothetical protein
MLSSGRRFFSEAQRQWFADGKDKEKAEAILVVLDARGLSVSPEQRDRILACSDERVLERWLRTALTAASASDLFV